MELVALPLTRKLSTLEVLDAAVWFVRDHWIAWTILAGSGGVLFSLLLAAFHAVADTPTAGGSLGGHFLRVWLFAGLVAAAFMARGIGFRAATEFFRAKSIGPAKSLSACLLDALARGPGAIFLSGVPGAAALLGLPAGGYPGLAAVNAWCLGLPAAVFEDLDAGSALKRSGALMKKSFAGAALWLVVAGGGIFVFANLLLIGALLPHFVPVLIGVDLPMLTQRLTPGNPIFLWITAGISWTIMDLVRVAAFAVLYLNARTEREGSDLLARLRNLQPSRVRMPERDLV